VPEVVGEKLIVKLAGGAAAQVLALMNALYLKEKNNKEFLLKYYPYSTGTYWPFAIGFLVSDSEVLSVSGITRGLAINQEFDVGKIIRSHPLATKIFSYEKILSVLRKLKLEQQLQKIRGERAIEASITRLTKVSARVKAVSGGFVPLVDQGVAEEMDRRFISSGKKSPFSKANMTEYSPGIVIHYRMGDKRTKFSIPADFGGDGILDPTVFKEILTKLNQFDNPNIYVVSDEPKVAQKVLGSIGIRVKLNQKIGDVWEDIFLMSQADIFIGSWSQVSQLGAVCNISNGGKAFLPSSTQVGTKIRWKIDGVNFYQPRFLPESHEIYSPDFDLDDGAHSSYKLENN
jgi:hypothetical protein